jgi:hypothetical protein
MVEDFVIRDYRPQDLEGVLALVRELEAEMKEKFPDVSISPAVRNTRNAI